MTTVDRRDHARLILDRPAKLQCDQTGLRYLQARTHNISAGGALVQLEHPNVLLPGQRVHLAVAASNQPLLRGEQRVDAAIVRCLRHGGQQYLALRFTQPQRQLAQAV